MSMIRMFSRGSFLIKEGPELLSVKARLWLASFGVALAASVHIFKSSTYYQATALGTLLGIFGAGVLYWETIIGDEEASGIHHQISREGNSRKLSESELKSMLWYFQICSLEFIIFTTLFTYKWRHSADL